MVDVAIIAVIVMAMGGFFCVPAWLSWTSTKTLDLLKDQIQIEAIEKCLEEVGTKWRVEREAKSTFQG